MGSLSPNAVLDHLNDPEILLISFPTRSDESKASGSFVVATVERHICIDILAILEEGIVCHPHEQRFHVPVCERNSREVRKHGQELLGEMDGQVVAW